MTAEQAAAIAAFHRVELGIPEDFAVGSIEPRFIELVEGAPVEERSPPPPSRVRDALAWVITFGAGSSAVECAIESATSNVVRVRWSVGCRPSAEEEER